MTWMWYGLGALALWATSNIFGKIIISKFVTRPIAYLFYIVFIVGLFSLVIIPFQGLNLIPTHILILAFISSFFYVLGIIFYLVAIKNEEVSRVVPLWQFQPLFVILMAFAFLGERLTTWQYLAFLCLVLGGLLISLNNSQGVFKIRKAFFIMILSSLAFAIYEVCLKYVYQNTDYWNGFIWIRIFALLIGLFLLIYKPYRNDFIFSIRQLSLVGAGSLLFSEITDFGGLLLYYYAVTIGPISLLNAIHGFQSIFVLIFAIILSLWFPKLLKEEMSKKDLFNKIAAILLLFLGGYLIYM